MWKKINEIIRIKLSNNPQNRMEIMSNKLVLVHFFNCSGNVANKRIGQKPESKGRKTSIKNWILLDSSA